MPVRMCCSLRADAAGTRLDSCRAAEFGAAKYVQDKRHESPLSPHVGDKLRFHFRSSPFGGRTLRSLLPTMRKCFAPPTSAIGSARFARLAVCRPQADPVHLIELASFLGLDCTEGEALELWGGDTTSKAGNFMSVGLTHETVEFMNTTMASLLPAPMLERYGLTPIYP